MKTIGSIGKWVVPGLSVLWLLSLVMPYGGYTITVKSASGPEPGVLVAIGLYYNAFGAGDTAQKLVFAGQGVTGQDGSVRFPRKLAFRPFMDRGWSSWFAYWEIRPLLIAYKPGFSFIETRLAAEKTFLIDRLNTKAERLSSFRDFNVRDEILSRSAILQKMLTQEHDFLFPKKEN